MNRFNYTKWSEIKYAGEYELPIGIEPNAGLWPTYFICRDSSNNIVDVFGRSIRFMIRNPKTINFQSQLWQVQNVLKNTNSDQITIAEYWDEGPPTKQWTPIADRLIDTYDVTAPQAGRILAALQAGINDAFVLAWYYKYLWEVPRPNQLDQTLATIVCTPKHPSYPSGHAVVAGCAYAVLSYFFPSESWKLRDLAEECAISRLYGGVHYSIDNDEGLRLGRQMGKVVVNTLRKQNRGIYDSNFDFKNADLMPPPYVQVIPYDREKECSSLVL